MNGSDYDFSARLMHRLALQSTATAEMAFDIDQMAFGSPGPNSRPVFVSGLARSGTTMLMRYLYESGEFSSLTYRDMPFVLMPRLWSKLSRGKADGTLRERAHKDGIMVSFDSPEAFEEVFWRVFTGKQYIRPDRLLRYTNTSPATVEKFRKYVAAVCEPGKRYLSKNNNNILRFGILHDAFPDATIIVPFREPLQHAASLLNQHRHFLKEQSSDKFVLDYMTWLGHHEFGKDQRPFYFGDSEVFSRLKQSSLDSLDFWLLSWINYYSQVFESAPANSLLVCYEDFCESPGLVLKAVFRKLAINPPDSYPSAFTPKAKTEDTYDPAILAECQELYKLLMSRSISLIQEEEHE